MTGGAFEIRNDVRLSVKRWLRQHDETAYEPGPIRRLVLDTVRSDRDPVDSLEDSWREASYGALLGIVEFASEEIADLMRTAAGNRQPLENAFSDAGEALGCLPYSPMKMRALLNRAATDLRLARETTAERALPGVATTESNVPAARALGALTLAQNIMC